MTAAIDTMAEEKQALDAIRRAHVANIRKLRDSLCEPLESVEWRSIPIGLRTIIVLMAGLDEGHECKVFSEFTPPERTALKVQIRSIKRGLAPLIALSGW